MTTAGITIRRRKRSDGIDPFRTHSYAVDREMPRRRAASSTLSACGVEGDGSTRAEVLVTSGEGYLAILGPSIEDVPDHRPRTDDSVLRDVARSCR